MTRRGSLLFVNQHYYPDVASTGQHLTDLAEHLAGKGWAVEVMAARGRYLAGRMAVPRRELRHGVMIRRLRTASFGRGSHLGRLADYASFSLQVLARLLFGRRRTGVVFLTTPPLLAVIGVIVRLLRRQRYGVWSMDLHPDAEIASGMLRTGGLVARLLGAANALSLRQADFVVDLGRHMKQRITTLGVSPERCHTIPVWSDARAIVPTDAEENPLAERLGLGEKFVVMYSGNAGIVHDFRDILEAIRKLADDPGIHFLFVGDGPRRGEIERFVREHDILNVEYRGYFARDELRWSLSLADAHLVSLREPFVGVSVPGKLYGIMASGRPAIFVGPQRSETAEAILAADCGVVIDPARGDGAERIVETVRAWCADPARARALGARGRAAFEMSYERGHSCAAFEEILQRVWTLQKARSPELVPEMVG